MSEQGGGSNLEWGAGVRLGRSLRRARTGEAVRVSYIVMQEKGDPAGGIVQEHQPLQEAGQEWGRLFHKHSQKHPGGRLEDTWQGSEESPEPPPGLSSTTHLARFAGSGALPPTAVQHALPGSPTSVCSPALPLLTCPPGSILRSRSQNPQPPPGVQPLGT